MILATEFGRNGGKAPTCRISSMSRPASFFMAETLPPNFRIVSRPKVGTWRNLHYRGLINCAQCAVLRTYRASNKLIAALPIV